MAPFAMPSWISSAAMVEFTIARSLASRFDGLCKTAIPRPAFKTQLCRTRDVLLCCCQTIFIKMQCNPSGGCETGSADAVNYRRRIHWDVIAAPMTWPSGRIKASLQP